MLTNTTLTTTNKDRFFGENGIVFTRAYSQATKTRPSVPSMMTGLLPTATGVYWFTDHLADEFLTLPEVLRSQGFVTASFIQNYQSGKLTGLDQGFSHFYGVDVCGGSTESLYERLLPWLEQHKEENTFVYAHIMDPHGVYDPPPSYRRWHSEVEGEGAKIIDRYSEYLDPDWETRPSKLGREALYDGEIRHNDDVFKNLVDRLKEWNMLDDTILIFIGDHGEFLGEKGLWEHHPPGFVQVINVPFLLHYPRRFEGGRRVNEGVQLIDLMPTILELAGIDSKKFALHGRSLLDLIAKKRKKLWKHRLLVSEEPTTLELQGDPDLIVGSLIKGNQHWIRAGVGLPYSSTLTRTLSEPEVMIFDMSSNPEEFIRGRALSSLLVKQVYSDLIRRIRDLSRKTKGHIIGSDDEDYEHEVDPEAVKQLRDLGYLN